MWKDGGIKGLFKGNLATIMKVAPQTAVQFAVRSTLPPLLFTVRTANFPQFFLEQGMDAWTDSFIMYVTRSSYHLHPCLTYVCW